MENHDARRHANEAVDSAKKCVQQPPEASVQNSHFGMNI